LRGMGINNVTFDWLLKLEAADIIGHGETMLELGPQDIVVSPLHVMARLSQFQRPDLDLNSLIGAGGRLSRSSQRILYTALGVGQYLSADIWDPRADYRIDLNYPVQDQFRKFDLITNIGTAEHVFNVAQVFITIHQLLNEGGIVLHTLPSLGDCNHGFWNIHPTVYFDLARENGYEILDYQYVDNMFIRSLKMNQSEELEALTARFDFDALPIKINFSSRSAPFQVQNPHFTQMAATQYLNNAADPEIRRVLQEQPTKLFDYSYVAMRKLPSLGQQGFKFPAQSEYL